MLQGMESGIIASNVAGIDCLVEVGPLPTEVMERFEPFEIPEWSLDRKHSMRVYVDEVIERYLARRHSSWNAAQLQLGSLCYTMLNGFSRANVLAVNGVCVSYQKRAYLFSSPAPHVAQSHALLWRQYLGDDVCLLGEGWVALSESKQGRDSYIVASATPWWNAFEVTVNASYPLNGWCFVASPSAAFGADAHPAERVDPPTVVDDAVRRIFIPGKSRDAALSLDVLDRVMLLCPLYRAQYDDRFGDEHVAESTLACVFESMTGLSYVSSRLDLPMPVLSDRHAWSKRG